MKIKISEALRMAIDKDMREIDDSVKKPAKKEEHFVECPDCNGSGLQGDSLCARCSGSGKVLGS